MRYSSIVASMLLVLGLHSARAYAIDECSSDVKTYFDKCVLVTALLSDGTTKECSCVPPKTISQPFREGPLVNSKLIDGILNVKLVEQLTALKFYTGSDPTLLVCKMGQCVLIPY